MYALTILSSMLFFSNLGKLLSNKSLSTTQPTIYDTYVYQKRKSTMFPKLDISCKNEGILLHTSSVSYDQEKYSCTKIYYNTTHIRKENEQEYVFWEKFRSACNGKPRCNIAEPIEHLPQLKCPKSPKETVQANVIEAEFTCRPVDMDEKIVFDMTRNFIVNLIDNKTDYYLIYNKSTDDLHTIKCTLSSTADVRLEVLYIDWRSRCPGRLHTDRNILYISSNRSGCKRKNINGLLKGNAIYLNLTLKKAFVWIEIKIGSLVMLQCKDTNEVSSASLAERELRIIVITMGSVLIALLVLSIILCYCRGFARKLHILLCNGTRITLTKTIRPDDNKRHCTLPEIPDSAVNGQLISSSIYNEIDSQTSGSNQSIKVVIMSKISNQKLSSSTVSTEVNTDNTYFHIQRRSQSTLDVSNPYYLTRQDQWKSRLKEFKEYSDSI